jgi:hypothetical protein
MTAVKMNMIFSWGTFTRSSRKLLYETTLRSFHMRSLIELYKTNKYVIIWWFCIEFSCCMNVWSMASSMRSVGFYLIRLKHLSVCCSRIERSFILLISKMSMRGTNLWFFSNKLFLICCFSIETAGIGLILSMTMTRILEWYLVWNILSFILSFIIEFRIIWLICIFSIRNRGWAFMLMIVIAICRLQ